MAVSFQNPFYSTYLKIAVQALTTSSTSQLNEVNINVYPTSPVIYILKMLLLVLQLVVL